MSKSNEALMRFTKDAHHPQRIENMAMTLGSEKKARRFARMAVTAVSASPDLLQCDPLSLWTAIYRCCDYNMEPGVLAHIVKFKNTATFIPDYKGIKEAIYRSPEVDLLVAKVIEAEDHFDDSRLGEAPEYRRQGARSLDPSGWRGAFAAVKLANGSWVSVYMERHEIEDIRDKASKAWGYKKEKSPWGQYPKPMWLKTVIKQLPKIAPVSLQAQEVSVLDDRAEVGASQGIIDLALDPGKRSEETLDDLQKKLAAGGDDDGEPSSSEPAEGGGEALEGEPVGADDDQPPHPVHADDIFGPDER